MHCYYLQKCIERFLRDVKTSEVKRVVFKNCVVHMRKYFKMCMKPYVQTQPLYFGLRHRFIPEKARGAFRSVTTSIRKLRPPSHFTWENCCFYIVLLDDGPVDAVDANMNTYRIYKCFDEDEIVFSDNVVFDLFKLDDVDRTKLTRDELRLIELSEEALSTHRFYENNYYFVKDVVWCVRVRPSKEPLRR